MIKHKILILTAIILSLFFTVNVYASEASIIEKTAFTRTSTNDSAAVRLQFPNMIEYMDGDLRVRLYLDESTIDNGAYRTIVSGDTERFIGLAGNEPVATVPLQAPR